MGAIPAGTAGEAVPGWKAKSKNGVASERKSRDGKAVMNDEQDSTKHMAEQWSAFQKIWGETFNKLMQLGFTFSPESAPPEFMRQMRSGIFQALAQSWDHFLRSPQFMEAMKQHMDNAIAFRRMSSDFFNKVRHETQSTTRDDIDSVMLAVRHMESRVLDRVEELAAQVDAVNKRLDAVAGRGATAPSQPKGKPRARPARNPRKR
jgi:hypothetical protein